MHFDAAEAWTGAVRGGRRFFGRDGVLRKWLYLLLIRDTLSKFDKKPRPHHVLFGSEGGPDGSGGSDERGVRIDELRDYAITWERDYVRPRGRAEGALADIGGNERRRRRRRRRLHTLPPYL